MLASKLDQIEANQQAIACHLPISQPVTDQAWQDFVLNFVYHSCHVDGNPLTFVETQALLQERATLGGKRLKDYVEAVNLEAACYYIRDLALDSQIVDQNLIKKIHSIVRRDEIAIAGQYKTADNQLISPDILTAEVWETPMRMDQVIQKYHNIKLSQDQSIFEVIAWFHAHLEKIHPFQDGNGHVGRLLINFDLIQNGYLPIIIHDQEASAYYAAIDQANDQDDCQALIDLLMDKQLAAQASFIKRIRN
ncbi:hypothetical protein AWM75_01315 [Aerococcus urinaehominis]|uniref:Uncharacterized protein n=1 Tax=Aerococcus urinaehominis TaxID=128944 RepID=A0A0X8FJZ7_9LACT|nr:Fic family protein [Aerococcus urinaehominis]AMB98716.1 hypothetical protein AWM75_01315 [Aerococcus urinaehominis]SDL99885.1 Fic/DOC family protein [Aerococcus urinaehominis]